MRLLPVNSPGGPPSVGPTLRGVAIHWIAPDAAVTLAGQKFRPTIPEPSWHVLTVAFRALTLDGSDNPPRTTVEENQMVHQACAIASVQSQIPADSALYYEVGTWSG